MPAEETRLYDAPALPCSGCGAPLPVDPMAAHAWCAMGHVCAASPTSFAGTDRFTALAESAFELAEES